MIQDMPHAPAWLIQRAAKIRLCHTSWQDRTFQLTDTRLGQSDATGAPGEIVLSRHRSVVIATGKGNIETRIGGQHELRSWRRSNPRIVPSVGARLDSATWPGWEQFASWAAASADRQRREGS